MPKASFDEIATSPGWASFDDIASSPVATSPGWASFDDIASVKAQDTHHDSAGKEYDSLAPRPQSFFDRAKEAIVAPIREGSIGRAFHQDTLTEAAKQEDPRLQGDTFARFSELHAENLLPKDQKVARGVVKGGEQFASGILSPANLAIMAGTMGLGEVPGAAATLGKVIGAGFSFDMVKSAADMSPKLMQQIKIGDHEGAAETITEMGASLGMAGLTAEHITRRGGGMEPPPTKKVSNPVEKQGIETPGIHKAITLRDRFYHSTSANNVDAILDVGILPGNQGVSLSRVPRINSNFGGEGKKAVTFEIDRSKTPLTKPTVNNSFNTKTTPTGSPNRQFEFEERAESTVPASAIKSILINKKALQRGIDAQIDEIEANGDDSTAHRKSETVEKQIARIKAAAAAKGIPVSVYEDSRELAAHRAKSTKPLDPETKPSEPETKAAKTPGLNPDAAKATFDAAHQAFTEFAGSEEGSADLGKLTRPLADRIKGKPKPGEEGSDVGIVGGKKVPIAGGFRIGETVTWTSKLGKQEQAQIVGPDNAGSVNVRRPGGPEFQIDANRLSRTATQGMPPPPSNPKTAQNAARILEFVKREEPDEVPISTLRLRKQFPEMSKQEFDDAALLLRDQQAAYLGFYADTGNISPEDRELLIYDPSGDGYVGSKDIPKGTYSVAISVRKGGSIRKFLEDEEGAQFTPKKVLDSIQSGYEIARDVIAPRFQVKPENLDIVMGMQGERNLAEFKMDRSMAEIEDNFSDRNQAENIKFIDNIKEGKSQGNPYWDKVAAGMRLLDNTMHATIEKYKPTLPWKENHYRVIYKRPPEWARQDPTTGQATPLNAAAARRGGIPHLGRSRPLQGTRGWAKKAVLPNLSEGLKWEFEATPADVQARAQKAGLGPNDALIQTVQYPSSTEVHITPLSSKGTKFVEDEESLGTPLYKRGGEPISYNPQTLFKTAIKDQMRFVTAQKMWEMMGNLGKRKFVKVGDTVPDNMSKLDDRIAKVFFSSPQGMVETGEWYVDKELGKLLNNFLSPDWLRDTFAADASGKPMLKAMTRLGRGLLAAKNMQTGYELLGPGFHVTFETLDAIASQFGRGFTRAWNEGVRQGSMSGIVGGLKDFAEGPVSPYTTAKLGGDIQRAAISQRAPHVRPPATGTVVGNLKRTLQGKSRALTPQDIIRGSEYLQKNPQAHEAIAMLFKAGLKPEMAHEYKLNSLRAFNEAVQNVKAGIDPTKNFLGAALRVVPAINQLIMKPLFEEYIPKLKIGQAMKEYSGAIRENANELANGTVTKEQLARDVVFRVEARFGEMNFDNLFWNNTMKTAMQILFRSSTWRIGTLQAFGGALGGQLAEFAEPLDVIAEHMRSGKQTRPKSDYIPKMHPMMGWLMGLITTRLIYSAIRQQLAIGQMPQNLKDWMWPRTGGNDDRGKPLRENAPTYLNDAVKIWKSPTNYVTAGIQGLVKNVSEAWNNEDFFKNFVYDPDAPLFNKTVDALGHVIGKPFFLQQWDKSGDMGMDRQGQFAGLMGLQRAPSDVDVTDAEAKALEINHRTTRKKTPEEAREQTEHFKIGKGVRAGDPKAIAAYENLTHSQRAAIDRRGQQTYLQSLIKGMTAEDALAVWQKATPTEKDQIRDEIAKKLAGKMKRSSEDNSEKLQKRATKDGLLVP